MNPELVKARAALITDQPFFGTLMLKLKVKEWEDSTGATDGVNLFYNLKWFLKLPYNARLGFLAHEIMHIVGLHPSRRGERHPRKWNVACDYAINNYLIKQGFILPDGGLVDDQYDDMSAEEIYELLPEPPSGWDSVSIDFGGCGGVLDHPGLDGTDGTFKTVESELRTAIAQSAEAAKMSGNLPGALKSFIDQALEPQVDWKTVLARFLTANNKNDYSWLKANRRFIGNGLYLPSLYSTGLEEIVIAVDTSGSVSNEELEQFTGETSAILRELNPEKIQFLQCDTEVCATDEYTKDNLPLEVTYEGRGGTCFYPVINHINEHFPNIRALVYLTDLGVSYDDFGEAPDYPVLWVSTHPADHLEEGVPYGEVIQMQKHS